MSNRSQPQRSQTGTIPPPEKSNVTRRTHMSWGPLNSSALTRAFSSESPVANSTAHLPGGTLKQLE